MQKRDVCPAENDCFPIAADSVERFSFTHCEEGFTMNINKCKEDGALTIALVGRLDTVTAPELEKTLQSDLDGVNALTFDLKDLEYISSAGLRVLLSAQKAMTRNAGTMKVKNANEIVMEVFEVTGFSDILTIE